MCTIMGYCGTGAGMEKVTRGLEATVSRGPDDCRIIDLKDGVLGFQRLSIMGLTPEGMQPFELMAIILSATVRSTALRKSSLSLFQRAIHLKAAATARFFCRCTKSTAQICLQSLTRSLPA